MYDFSDLSYSELLELEKEIRKAKENCGTKCKANLCTAEVVEKIANAFNKNKPSNLKDSYGITLWLLIEHSIYNICDVTLGNYTLKKAAKSTINPIKTIDGNKKYRVSRNGSSIMTDPDEYKKMFTDILNVCIKYSRMSKPVKIEEAE